MSAPLPDDADALPMLKPFELRREFRQLSPAAESPIGPYEVGDLRSLKLPYADKGVYWKAPLALQLRGLAVALWCGSEYDCALLRVHGNPKQVGPHSTLFHLHDRWTSRLLDERYGAHWNESLAVHEFASKLNLPRLITDLLTFYRAIVIDFVKEEETRIFVPLPERPLPEQFAVYRNVHQSDLVKRSQSPRLIERLAQEEKPAAHQPRLKLTPRLPTLPPFLVKPTEDAPPSLPPPPPPPPTALAAPLVTAATPLSVAGPTSPVLPGSPPPPPTAAPPKGTQSAPETVVPPAAPVAPVSPVPSGPTATSAPPETTPQAPARHEGLLSFFRRQRDATAAVGDELLDAPPPPVAPPGPSSPTATTTLGTLPTLPTFDRNGLATAEGHTVAGSRSGRKGHTRLHLQPKLPTLPAHLYDAPPPAPPPRPPAGSA